MKYKGYRREIATPDSFSVELHGMPERHIVLPLNLSFTASEMDGIACGFIPHDMNEKWFMYFIDGLLFMRRSWTGYLIYVVHFVQEGECWRATRAEVNRDREQYGNEDDDEDRRLIAEMIDVHLVNPEPPHKNSFLAALELAAQPNYLGSPQVVRDVLAPVFATVVGRWVYLHVPSCPEVTNTQVSDACRLAEQVFSGNHPDYTAMPGWHSVEELGQVAILRLGLDPDYCAGENLFFIISESIAAVSLAINRLLNDWAESPMCNWMEAVAQLHRMQEFVESVMLGTHTLRYPDLTLQHFGWPPDEGDIDEECDEEEDGDDEEFDDDEEVEDEEEEVVMNSQEAGVVYHPKLDDKGKKVRLHHPHAPKLEGFDNPLQTVTICPGNAIPAGLNGMAFSPWMPPATWNEWADIDGQMEMEEPPLKMVGHKQAASGVLIVEPDNRAWIVSPSNGYGGYKNTFPKGKNEDDLPLQANAIREAWEESGLKVEIIELLGDVERTTTVTRYYLGRRVGGTPADMGWESQAVHLCPIHKLRDFLDSKNDHEVVNLLADGDE